MKEYLLAACIFCLLPVLVWGQPKFTDVTTEAGIDHQFKVFQGTFGGGAAVIDFNNDGWEDLFVAGGEGADQLLLNQGNGTFKNVATDAGLSLLDGFVTQGAAVADVNKDGWPDLYVTTIAFVTNDAFRLAPNVLLINNRDGSFRDESEAYSLAEPTFSSGASFGDINADGYPDLYVSNYFDRFEGTLDEFAGPQTAGDIQPGKDLFYINNGGNRFIESSEAYGIVRPGLTFQALWSDFDNDNDLDILVANDFGNRTTPNLLYRNNHPEPGFSEIGAEVNFNFGINGMGIGACDINKDGWLDYLVTNIQVSPFLVNQGKNAPFLEESVDRGAGFAQVSTEGGVRVTPVSWGVNFFDMDHDMDQDLYITNGSLNPPLAPNPNLHLVNNGGFFRDFGSFSKTNDQSIGRGSIVFDYDKDGDLDLFVVNQGQYRDENLGIEFAGSRLFRNDNDSDYNWLQVKLVGKQAEESGIGARLEAHVGGEILIREVYGGSSHMSQNTTLVHFGLGENTIVDSLIIKWTTSTIQSLDNVAGNQVITVEEEIDIETFDEGIRVSPNPFFDRINIVASAELSGQMAEVRLYNMLGQLVFTERGSQLQPFGSTINVDSRINPGMYLLVVEGADFLHSRKLMKFR